MTDTSETEGETDEGGVGIDAIGAYVPRLAFPSDAHDEAWGTGGPRGIDRTAVPEADEDAITMATEAGRRALDASSIDRADVTRLAFATTTPPVDEEDLTARLASLLGLSDAVEGRQYGGSPRAGVAAIADAARRPPADGSGGGRTGSGVVLVVAADCPTGSPESDEEATAGAGAGAIVLRPGASSTVTATGEHGEPAPGTRFRRRGSTDVESIGVTSYERGAYRTAVAGAIEDLGALVDLEALDAAALAAPNGGLPYRAAGAAGLTTEQVAAGTVVSSTGDIGSAGPLVGAAAAVRDGASSLVLVGYGGGSGATAVLLEPENSGVDAADGDDVDTDGSAGVTPAVDAVLEPTRDLTFAEYARRRGHVTGDEPEGGGANVSVPSWRRTSPQRHRLEAGRCPACGTLAFPPEGACTDCGALVSFEPVALPGTGTVEAATGIGQGGAPPEFVVLQQHAGEFGVAIVAFDGPGDDVAESGDDPDSTPDDTVSIPVALVPDVSTPEIGDHVVAVPRRIYQSEGVVRYGFKVAPASWTDRD